MRCQYLGEEQVLTAAPLLRVGSVLACLFSYDTRNLISELLSNKRVHGDVVYLAKKRRLSKLKSRFRNIGIVPSDDSPYSKEESQEIAQLLLKYEANSPAKLTLILSFFSPSGR